MTSGEPAAGAVTADPTDDLPVTDDLVVDLLEDVREVSGVLAFAWPDVPSARTGGPDLAAAAARLEGYAAHGS